MASCLTSGARREAGALGSRNRSVLWRVLFGLLVAVGFASVYAGESGAQQVSFDIPSQRADKALAAFAEQANVTLVFSFDLANQATANPLVGQYTVTEGLQRLLDGTGLVGTVNPGSYLTITKAQTEGTSANMNRKFRSGVFGALLGFLSGHASAQTDADTGVAEDRAVLTEIVVTARKSEENLQTVPLSISAFTARDIESAGYNSITDLAAMTPGFSFREGFGRQADRPVIRGMSNIQGDPNASFFIDGIYVSGPISGYSLDNLERVEVIRGPQSALFGRRTFSGAINYITKAPTDEYAFDIKQMIGNFDLIETSLNASGPIVDEKLRFQLSGRYYDRGGQYYNTVSGRKDLGGERSKSINGGLFWTPVDWFDATLRLNYAVDSDQHVAIARLGSPGLPYDDDEIRNCFEPLAGTRRRGYHCGVVPVPDFAEINTVQFHEAGERPGIQRNLFRSSLQLNAQFADYTFTSTTAWNESSTYAGTDQDFSSARSFGGVFETITFNNQGDWSQELRVASPRDRRFRWMAGVSLYEEQPDDYAWSGSLVAGPPGQPDLPPNISRQRVDSKTTNEALFALLEFDVTDQVKLTAEARYAEDEITVGGTSRAVKASATGFIPGSYSDGCTLTSTATPAAPNAASLTCVNDYHDTKTFESFLPRFTATWLLNDDVTLYAQIAKGNKPGGFNTAANNARATPAERANVRTLGLDSFDEEEADSYELGAKTRFLDGRMQLNVSAYLIDWTNQQLTQTHAGVEEGQPVGGSVGRFGTSYTTNLGVSEVRGLEAELLAKLGWNWDVQLSYALQDTEIKKYANGDQADLMFPGPYTPSCEADTSCYAAYLAAGSVAGNELPRVPKHTVSAAATMRLPVTDSGSIVWRTSYRYESSLYAQVHNLASTGDSNIVDMRLGWETDNWSITAWVDNLMEEDAAIDILRYIEPEQFIVVPVQPPLPGTVTVTNPIDMVITLPPKRKYGLTATYRF